MSITKQCSKCKQYKLLSEFHKKRNSHDGYTSRCKDCRNKVNRQWERDNPGYQQQWYEEHPDYHKNYTKKWRKEHPGRRIENERRWRERNQEKTRAKGQRWRTAHPNYTKEWFANNKEKDREYSRKQRAQKLAAPGNGFSEKEFLSLCDKYNNQCPCCGRDNVLLTRDHIVPLSKGGADSIDNIQPLCKSCNSKKGTRSTDYRL